MVVPPVAVMQDVGDAMQAEVARLKAIIAQYDENLSIKCNKQELMDVDNKFRLFIKKDKYKPFKDETELDVHDLKTEVKSLIRDLDTLKKNV